MAVLALPGCSLLGLLCIPAVLSRRFGCFILGFGRALCALLALSASLHSCCFASRFGARNDAPLLAPSASCICSVRSGGAVSPEVWGAPWPRSAFLMVGFELLFHYASSWVFGSPLQTTSPVCFLRSYGFSALGCCFILGSGLSLIRCCPNPLVVLLLIPLYAAAARVLSKPCLSALLALTGLAPSLPMRLCLLRLFSGPLLVPCLPLRLCLWRLFSGPLGWYLLRLFSGPLGWRPLFLSVCACCAYSRALGSRRVFLSVCACCAYSAALWAGTFSSYPFVLVAPILWPSGPLGWRPLFLSVLLVAPILWHSGLVPSLPMRLCFLGLFPGPLGWRPLFLSVCACCSYSLALWAGARSSYPFVLVAPIVWASGLSPSLPIRLCLLRLFSGPLGWRPVFQCVYACCAYSLALWVGAGALSSYPFVLVAPILWPAGLAPCLPICLCSWRRILGSSWLAFFLSFLFFVLFASIIGPLGWRPLFLFVRACCAYSRARCAIAVPLVLYWICAFLALWAGALSSYSFMLVSPVLWLSGLAFVLYWFCVSLTLWAGGLSSYPFMLVAPILSPSWHFPP